MLKGWWAFEMMILFVVLLLSCFDNRVKLILLAGKKPNSLLYLYMRFQFEGFIPFFFLVHKGDLTKGKKLPRAIQQERSD